jgi:hypothetical protein
MCTTFPNTTSSSVICEKAQPKNALRINTASYHVLLNVQWFFMKPHGLAADQYQQFCLFTSPQSWQLASSLIMKWSMKATSTAFNSSSYCQNVIMDICVISEQRVSTQLRARMDETSDMCNMHYTVVQEVPTACTSFLVDHCGLLTTATCTAMMMSDGLKSWLVLEEACHGLNLSPTISVSTSMLTYQMALPYTSTSCGRQAGSVL